MIGELMVCVSDIWVDNLKLFGQKVRAVKKGDLVMILRKTDLGFREFSPKGEFDCLLINSYSRVVANIQDPNGNCPIWKHFKRIRNIDDFSESEHLPNISEKPQSVIEVKNEMKPQ